MLKKSPEIYHLGLDDNKFMAAIYEQYGKKLYSYAVCTWKLDEDPAWDLVYKTLDKITASYKNYTFESEGKFASFIFKVFINYLRNHYRANKKLPQNLALNENDGATLAEKDEPIENSNPKLVALNEELEKMEDWQRMLLLMRSEGWSYADISQYVDKPENQLKVYYQRLKEQLSKRLHERI